MHFNQSHSSMHIKEGCITAYMEIMAVTEGVR